MRRRAVEWLLGALALLGSCYDTPLIPGGGDDDDDSAGGRSGSSAAGSAAVTAGKGGKSAMATGGDAQAGEPVKPSGGGGAAATGGVASHAGETFDGGQAGEPTVPRISWLSLAGSEAPATAQPNQRLGIQGSFYAYWDGCADVHWDAATRCINGKLCNPHVQPEAWGVAIGFDFRNTGENGSPPDTKLLWNPNDFGARGVAWRVSGPSAPAFQVWVLNMDPSWGGQCDAMTCEIEGPPDGEDSAALEGELLFSAMVKDDWNGSGISYAFDPAAVHALQLKLPAIRAPNATFDFCIDEVGIVR